MNLKNALKGTFVVFFFSVMTGFFGYLLRMLLARKLTVAEFGLFYSVMTVFFFIMYFIDSGMSQSIAKFIVELKIKRKTQIVNNLLFSVFYVQFAFSIIVSAFLIILSDFLSRNYFHNDVNMIIMILSVWLVTSVIISIYNSVFVGFQKFHFYAFFDMLKALCIFVFSLLLLSGSSSSSIPAMAFALSNILVVLAAYYFVKRAYPGFSFARFKFDKRLSSDAFKFGIFIALSNWIWFLITQTDTLVLTYYTGPVQVALYQVAVPISSLLLYLTNSLSLVIFPIVAELKSRNASRKMIAGLTSIYTYLIMLLLPAVIIILVFPDIIINILFTSKYLGAIAALRILAVASLFLSLAIINNSVLTALGNPKKVAKAMFFIALLNLALNLLLIPKLGIVGAALSTLISFMLASLVSSVHIRAELPVNYPIMKWTGLLFISLIIIAVVELLRNFINLGLWPKLLLVSVIVLSIYLSLVLMFRIVTFKDIKSLAANAFKSISNKDNGKKPPTN